MHLWPKIPGTANILNALLILFLPYSTSRSRGCHSVCLLEITSNVFIDRRWGWLYFPSSQQQIQCFISGRRWVIETLWAKWCSCCRRILRLLVFAWESNILCSNSHFGVKHSQPISCNDFKVWWYCLKYSKSKNAEFQN